MFDDINEILKEEKIKRFLLKLNKIYKNLVSKSELDNMSEEWVFTLDDNTTVTKNVICSTSQQ